MDTTSCTLMISLREERPERYSAATRFSRQLGLTEQETEYVPIPLDMALLRSQVNDEQGYGRALTKALFDAPELHSSWVKAMATAAAYNARLRLRLRIDGEASELHALRWELLRDPDPNVDDRLAISDRVLFSRYLTSTEPVPELRPVRRALLAIASPAGLGVTFAAIDVAAEAARVQAALGGLEHQLLGLDTPATLEAIIETLKTAPEPFDILYLLCHGVAGEGEGWLLLEDERRRVVRVSGRRLAEGLGGLTLGRRPSLMLLGACQSAGDESRAVFTAVGPLLARRGALAVVAMQGLVPQTAVERLVPPFLAALSAHGQVDRALAAARSRLANDWWAPVLFMRVHDGCIWAPTPAFSTPEQGAGAIIDGPLPDPNGVLEPESAFYVQRDEDTQLTGLSTKAGGFTVTIRAPRQTGKTSLLARAISQFQRQGAAVARLDIDEAQLSDYKSFTKWFVDKTTSSLDLDEAEVARIWRSPLIPNVKLGDLFEKYILPTVGGRVVLAFDNADRLLGKKFSDDFFGLLRSWHNKRASDPRWRLDMLIVISTAPHLLVKNMDQSPFNVGERWKLHDFTREQVAWLNERYRAPLAEADLDALFEYLGGHPYLTQLALHKLVTERLTWQQICAQAVGDEGPFYDHLWSYYKLTLGKLTLGIRPAIEKSELLRILNGKGCSGEAQFHQLERLGLIAGPAYDDCRFRCRFYEAFFARKLGVKSR